MAGWIAGGMMAPGHVAFNPGDGVFFNPATLAADEAGGIWATSFRSHDQCRPRNGVQANQRPLVDSEGISQHERFLVPTGPQAGNLNILSYFKGCAAEYHRRFVAAGIVGADLVARVALLAFTRVCILWFFEISGADLIPAQTDTWHPDPAGYCVNNVPNAATIAIWDTFATAIPNRGKSAKVCTGDTICSAVCNKTKFHHWLSGDNASEHDVHIKAHKAHRDQHDKSEDIHTSWGLAKDVFDNITCWMAAHPVKDAVMHTQVTDVIRIRVWTRAGFGGAQSRSPIQADFVRGLEGYFRVYDSARQLADVFNLDVGPAIPQTGAEYVLNAAIIGHGLEAGHTSAEMHAFLDAGTAVTTPGAAMGIQVPMTLLAFNGLQPWQQDILVAGVHSSAGPEIARLSGMIEGYAEALRAPLDPDNDLTGTHGCKRAKRDSLTLHLSGMGHGRACADFAAEGVRRGGIAGVSAGRGTAPVWKIQMDDPGTRNTSNLVTGLMAAMTGGRAPGDGRGAAAGPGGGP